MEFSECWSTAEAAIYNRLLTAAGSVDKVGAFRGYLPPTNYNIWMFKSGGPGTAQFTHNAPITSMYMAASIYGLFKERTSAQEFCMKIAQILPIKDESNIQMFRFTTNGVPDTELKYFPISNNQNEAVPLWETKMAFDLVFMTEGTYGDHTPLAPRKVAASAGLYADKVTITWNAAQGATGYEVWRSETNDYASAALLTSPAAGVLTYDDTTAVAETVYCYWLKARNASGVSVFSVAVEGHATSSTP
jgi:hypothetical protein